jgi:3-ketosteroid 9alpha-monooxygenase subunit A
MIRQQYSVSLLSSCTTGQSLLTDNDSINGWHNLLETRLLTRGAVVEMSWRAEDILVYRTAGDACYAISAYCAHTLSYMPNGLPPDAPLSDLLRGEEIRCPFHGWRYDGTGRCTEIPVSQRVPPGVRRGDQLIKSWQLRQSGSWIQIRN